MRVRPLCSSNLLSAPASLAPAISPPFTMWSSNVLDSKRVFSARLETLGLATPAVGEKTLEDKFKENGWLTLGNFAFAISFAPGQAASENDFVKGILEKLIGTEDQLTDVTRALKAPIRRLYFEAYSMAAGDMQRRLTTDPEPDRPRNLPPQERADRLERIKEKVKPVKIVGETEPSDTLVDKYSTMQENGILRYVPWEDVTRRDLEVRGVKKEKYWQEVWQGKKGHMQGMEVGVEDPADMSTDLKLERLLRRRSVALDMAHLMSYEVHENLAAWYLEALTSEPPKAHNKVTLEQVRDADMEIFTRLSELTRSGLPYNPDTGADYPLDAHVATVKNEQKVLLMMNPRQSGGGGPKLSNGDTIPARAADKRKDNRIAQLEAENKRLKNNAGIYKGGNQKGGQWPQKSMGGQGKGGGGSSKGAKGSKTGVKMPRELIGMNYSTKDGSPICFAYNMASGCKVPNCTRGLHVCARPGCGGSHPQHSSICPLRE